MNFLSSHRLLAIFRSRFFPFPLLALALIGCDEPIDAQQVAAPLTPPLFQQRGDGMPYELPGSSVYNVPDPVSGRSYQIFVDLPDTYYEQPARKYPAVYVTDADYAFPVVRNIARRLNVKKPKVEEFILIGLSYAKGETGMVSRRRDYTPTVAGSPDAGAGQAHGKGAAYRDYVRTQVMPYVDKRFRTSSRRSYYIGHSYGGLLGAQILFTQPDMFAGYVLGSPSLWYDQRHIFDLEKAFAKLNTNLAAKVYLYIGEYETVRKGDKRYYQDFFDMAADNRNLATALEKRSYADLDLKSDILHDEDHVTVAPRGFTKGLLYLLPASDR